MNGTKLSHFSMNNLARFVAYYEIMRHEKQ